MKRKILRFILGISIASFVLITSCKDDLSTLDVNKLPEISVDTTDQSQLVIFQFDKLIIDPKIIGENINSNRFKYEWLINLEPRSLEYLTIGMDKKLEYTVSFAPTSAGRDHQVLLKVTDVNSGIEYLQAWPLTIRNGIGEGLVIVETYDGLNTDLSHIMSPLVTPNYANEKITRKIFSAVNNKTIPGLVNNLSYTRFGANFILLGSTLNSLFSIKTIDYTFDKQNVDFYYADQPSYGASYISSVTGSDLDVIVKDSKLYANWLQITKIGLPFSNNYVIPSIIGLNPRSVDRNIVLNFYSEEYGHFVYQPSISSFGDRVMKPVPSASVPFNPNSVTNKVNVAAGVNQQNDFMHLLKDKTTGKFGIYILDAGAYGIASKPKQFVDLSNAPEINQATKFLLLDNQQVLLYATKTKIYAAIYSSSVPIYDTRYTVAIGEEITSLKVYHQANYPKSTNPYFERNGRQLILSTYNGTEGKVHVLPLINEGIANIDAPNIKTYSGFGKILFTTTQL